MSKTRGFPYLLYYDLQYIDILMDNNQTGKEKRIRRKLKYGEIPGIKVGDTFTNRKECMKAGVHCVPFAGIHGSKYSGAYSVCLSGGYVDDVDDGEFFIYAGTGGQGDWPARGNRKQVGNQSAHNALNMSLQVSLERKQPVRVVRKGNIGTKWCPAIDCYRYDGLYYVENFYIEETISGDEHKICKFEFRRLPNQPPLPVNPYYWLSYQNPPSKDLPLSTVTT